MGAQAHMVIGQYLLETWVQSGVPDKLGLGEDDDIWALALQQGMQL